MSPAHVLEPTYRRLKRKLVEGQWPFGTRLEAMRLAEEFGVSMTPVRDCLNQLVGEGLVDLTPGEGFRVPYLTDQGLRDHLHVHHALLKRALAATWRNSELDGANDASAEYSHRLGAVFHLLAAGGGNRLLTHYVQQIGWRLQSIRRHEPEILPGAESLLADLEASLTLSEADRCAAVDTYHDVCLKLVAALVARASA